MRDTREPYQHVRSRGEENLHKTDEVLDNFVWFVGTIGIEENVLEARREGQREVEWWMAHEISRDDTFQMTSKLCFSFHSIDAPSSSNTHQLSKYLLIEQVYSPDFSHFHLLTNDFFHHLSYQLSWFDRLDVVQCLDRVLMEDRVEGQGSLTNESQEINSALDDEGNLVSFVPVRMSYVLNCWMRRCSRRSVNRLTSADQSIGIFTSFSKLEETAVCIDALDEGDRLTCIVGHGNRAVEKRYHL